jgi:hypothetical protein
VAVRFFENRTASGLQICREMASSTGVVPQSCTDSTHAGNVMDFQGSGDNGNLYTATNKIDPTRTQTYTYDTVNRLLSATTSGKISHPRTSVGM